METLIYSIAIVSGLGIILGLALALADKYISVPGNEKEEKILACLSGANCGSCGFAGCAAMAKALASGQADMSRCPVASAEARERIASLLGTDAAAVVPKAAVIACAGGIRCTERGEYDGLKDCRAAAAGSVKGCAYGCIGLMSCAAACPEHAITLSDSGVPEVNREKCTACGKCAAACPRKLIHIIPVHTKVVLRCSTQQKGKNVREVCSVGCIGCGLCAKVCSQNAVTMQNGHPVVDNALCAGCGKCKERCPQHCLF